MPGPSETHVNGLGDTGHRNGPFAGLTVVEFGQFVVVPFCAQFLADGGARVIKVEPPEGDSYRLADTIAPYESRQYIIKNRGKASIAMRLGHRDCDEILRRLLRVADVVLVNMRPQTVEKHRLRYQDVATVNPSVIYGAVTAFGWIGPEASYPGMDVVVQARSGLLLALGAEREGVPYHSEVQVADYATSILLLAGITTALYTRAVSGQGQEVRVSLLGGALTMQNNVLGHFFEHDGWRHQFVEEVLPRARAEDWNVQQLDDARREMRADPRDTSYYRVFKTADGALAVGAGSPRVRESFLRVAGIDAAESPVEPALRREEVDSIMRRRSTQHWLRLLREAGVPTATVAHVDELLLDPSAEVEGLIWEGTHEVAGRYRALGVPIQLSGTPFRPVSSSPTFARDTESVLIELGFAPDEIQSMVKTGAVVTRSSAGPPPKASQSSGRDHWMDRANDE